MATATEWRYVGESGRVYTLAEWKGLTNYQRLVETGRRAPYGECVLCDRAAETGDAMMPRHRAMSSCRSGGYNHCTCDTCY